MRQKSFFVQLLKNFTLRGLFKTVSKQDYEWYVARMAEMEYGLILNSSEIIDESQLIQMLKEKYHLLE